MMYLKEYRDKPDCLADYLPWACFIAPGIILNKDGSFQRTAKFRGPDLESSTQEELVATCARINNAANIPNQALAIRQPGLLTKSVVVSLKGKIQIKFCSRQNTF